MVAADARRTVARRLIVATAAAVEAECFTTDVCRAELSVGIADVAVMTVAVRI